MPISIWILRLGMFLPLLKKCNSSNFMNQALLNEVRPQTLQLVVNDLMKHLFSENTLVCQTSDKDSVNAGLLDYSSLTNLGIQTVTVDGNHLEILRGTKILCDAYLVVTSAEAALKIFTTRMLIQNFKPHKRLLLVVDSDIRSRMDLEKALLIHDFDTVMVFRDSAGVLAVHHNNTVITSRNINDLTEFLKVKRTRKFEPGVVLRRFNQNLQVAASPCPPYVSNDSLGVDVAIMLQLAKKLPINMQLFPCSINLSDLLSESSDNSSTHIDLIACGKWLDETIGHPNMISTYPHVYMCPTFLVPLPRPISLYVQPFNTTLWLLYLAIIGIFSMVFHVACEVSQRQGSSTSKSSPAITITLNSGREGQIKNDYFVLAFSDVIRLTALSSLNKLPRADQYCLRFMLVIWMMGCILVATYYSAGLTAMLQHPRYTFDITTMQDMVDYKLKWASRSDYFQKIFETDSSAVMRDLSKLYDGTNLEPKQAAVAFVPYSHIKTGYVITAKHLQHTSSTDDMRLIKENIGCYYGSLMLRLNSPYKNLVNEIVGRCVESGLVIHWYKNFVRSVKNKVKLYQHHPMTADNFINVDNMQGAFYALLIGHALASGVFLCELLLGKKANKKASIVSRKF